MIQIDSIRHPREKDYFIVAAVMGGLMWFLVTLATFGLIIIYIGIGALTFWIMEKFFTAMLFGDSVKISEKQYPEINTIVARQCAGLGLEKVPDVFIVNGQGIVNAMAVRFLSKRYVLLMSDLVDLMLSRGQFDELATVIGHELGHHAAGHINVWRTLLIAPAKFVPFLGNAYSRACELTCDRIGFALTGNREASQRALAYLALGSRNLASGLNIEAFMEQEKDVPPFFGFLSLIFSTHPRMTLRIAELAQFKY